MHNKIVLTHKNTYNEETHEISCMYQAFWVKIQNSLVYKVNLLSEVKLIYKKSSLCHYYIMPYNMA